MAARRLAPGVGQLTIASASLAGASLPVAADVAIRFADGAGGLLERHYSAWRSDPRDGTLDICVVLHGLGFGALWAERAGVGDTLSVSVSRNPPVELAPGAEQHLFLGDETSVAGADALMRELSPGVRRLACFEVGSSDQRWPEAELSSPGCVTWIEREGRPGAALLTWLASNPHPSPASTAAYVTGETWLCSMAQSHLVREDGFRPGSVRALPFWKRKSSDASASFPRIQVPGA